MNTGALGTKGRLVTWLIATLMGTAATSASAQESSIQAVPDSGITAQLQEVIVTAEKRASRAQDVPISLTALTGAELEARGIVNLDDIMQTVPGVALTSMGPGQTEYTIRGMPSSGAFAATVGFYLDDVPVTPPAAAQNGHVAIDPDLYDLERIEVLRGPQGTLYGAGSMGGTIKLITNRPALDRFAASAMIDGSETHHGGLNSNLNGMLNIPLVPGALAVRVVATDRHTSGWIDRIVLGDFPLPTNPLPQCQPFYGCTRGNVLASPILQDYPRSNAEALKGVRATLRYQATERLSLTGMAFYQRIDQSGLSFFDSPPGTEAHYQAFNFPEPFSDTFHLYNLSADYSSPTVGVTSVTSYWTRAQLEDQDVTEAIQSLFALPSFYPADGGAGPVGYLEIDDTREMSQEIRLTSVENRALQWLLGFFYSDYHSGGSQDSLAAGLIPLFGTPNLFSDLSPSRMIQTAEFGQLSYSVTPRWKLAMGLRYFHYTERSTETSSGLATGSLSPVTIHVAGRNSGLNPKVTLSYEPTGDILVYADAAKGFRPGAGERPVPTSGADSCLSDLEAIGRTSSPTQYGPDQVWSYELGEKLGLLDRRLTVDSAVYSERWSKVQQSIALPCGFGYVDNVGTNKIWGGELELNARIGAHWIVSQSAGYTHPTVSGTIQGTGLQPGQNLLYVPTYTASTVIGYTRPLGDVAWVTKATTTLVGPSQELAYSLVNVPGYDLTNVRTGVVGAQWSAFLFVENATNKQAFLTYASNYALQFPSANRVATGQPRTVGVSANYRW